MKGCVTWIISNYLFTKYIYTLYYKYYVIYIYIYGGEYTSHAFKRFCAEAGIKRELTVPYTPQQNGVSERKNRAIVGAAKAMLHDQNLP
jgi:transposase InsO family protein